MLRRTLLKLLGLAPLAVKAGELIQNDTAPKFEHIGFDPASSDVDAFWVVIYTDEIAEAKPLAGYLKGTKTEKYNEWEKMMEGDSVVSISWTD